MKSIKKVFVWMSVLALLVLLSGCAPIPPGPGAPIPPGVAFSCMLPLVILLVIAIIAALLVYIVRNKPPTPPDLGKPDKRATSGVVAGKVSLDLSAEEIARRRYASGEITYEEFQQILRNLRNAEKGDVT